MASTPDSSINRYIALFGDYKYGRFGDDLMAVIFGRELQSHHIPFRVYGLQPERRAEFQFQGTNSINELLSGAAAVVYGGGWGFSSRRAHRF